MNNTTFGLSKRPKPLTSLELLRSEVTSYLETIQDKFTIAVHAQQRRLFDDETSSSSSGIIITAGEVSRLLRTLMTLALASLSYDDFRNHGVDSNINEFVGQCGRNVAMLESDRDKLIDACATLIKYNDDSRELIANKIVSQNNLQATIIQAMSSVHRLLWVHDGIAKLILGVENSKRLLLISGSNNLNIYGKRNE